MGSRVRSTYLLHRYKDDIFRFALWKVKNRHDAEDITQEVLLKLWEHNENIQRKSIRAWVLKTTHNLCIDYLRKRQLRKKYEPATDEETFAYILESTTSGNSSSETDSIFLNEELTAALEQLPELQKTILIFYEVEGLKYREISDILEIPINSVKVNIFRARKALQTILKHHKNDA